MFRSVLDANEPQPFPRLAIAFAKLIFAALAFAALTALDQGQRHFVALLAVDHHDPGIAIELGLDLAGG